MHFEINKQTIEDLNIYSASINIKSIASLFSGTRCFGGKDKVYELLATPLSDYEKLKDRSQIIQFFSEHSFLELEFDTDALSFAEYYQKQRRNSMPPTWGTAFWRHVYDKLNNDAQYYLMEKGVHSTIEILKWINQFSLSLIHKNTEARIPLPLLEQCEKVQEILSTNEYDKLLDNKKIGKYSLVGKLDYQFRIKDRRNILFCLDLIHQYDAFSTIARVAQERGFTFANLYEPNESKIEIKGLFHPLLDEAIPNDISFDNKSNVLFLSGPNMSGKSTLLKSLAISVFLAHAGFPVPATKMDISVLSGLSTTINIADNLSSGYSHFYAEVMQIKEVALQLKERRNILVIFDELFRGTNVKDAYDGTVAIIKAFSKIKEAFFVVSTHIVEVADELTKIDNIKFSYLNIEQKDEHPVYTYQIKEGISKDRLGMYIIKKEGLLELLENCSDKEV